MGSDDILNGFSAPTRSYGWLCMFISDGCFCLGTIRPKVLHGVTIYHPHPSGKKIWETSTKPNGDSWA